LTLIVFIVPFLIVEENEFCQSAGREFALTLLYQKKRFGAMRAAGFCEENAPLH